VQRQSRKAALPQSRGTAKRQCRASAELHNGKPVLRQQSREEATPRHGGTAKRHSGRAAPLRRGTARRLSSGAYGIVRNTLRLGRGEGRAVDRHGGARFAAVGRNGLGAAARRGGVGGWQSRQRPRARRGGGGRSSERLRRSRAWRCPAKPCMGTSNLRRSSRVMRRSQVATSRSAVARSLDD
jgi:hypothetical protein